MATDETICESKPYHSVGAHHTQAQIKEIRYSKNTLGFRVPYLRKNTGLYTCVNEVNEWDELTAGFVQLLERWEADGETRNPNVPLDNRCVDNNCVQAEEGQRQVS